ncbi:MAG: 16S rRNA (guanine(527)-N(7))-methyltransferase RsmG [Burkholderiaceae bacterium]
MPLIAGMQQLGLDTDSQVIERLLAYRALLERWGRVFNLTAIRDPMTMVSAHLLDCLAVIPALRRHWGHMPSGPWVDVGSGAGLPGIILAITEPHQPIHLVEPVGKKAAFLRQCCGELGLRAVRVHECRIEDSSARTLQAPAAAMIICRAFASLADFVGGARHLIGPDTRLVAMKAARWQQEVNDYATAGAANDNRGIAIEDTLTLQVPMLDATRALILLKMPSPDSRNTAD